MFVCINYYFRCHGFVVILSSGPRCFVLLRILFDSLIHVENITKARLRRIERTPSRVGYSFLQACAFSFLRLVSLFVVEVFSGFRSRLHLDWIESSFKFFLEQGVKTLEQGGKTLKKKALTQDCRKRVSDP